MWNVLIISDISALNSEWLFTGCFIASNKTEKSQFLSALTVKSFKLFMSIAKNLSMSLFFTFPLFGAGDDLLLYLMLWFDWFDWTACFFYSISLYDINFIQE